ncbi:MAG: DUF924 family protein [Myxococcota bacterium]
MSDDAEELLAFWFGPLDADGAPGDAARARWFDPPDGFDAELARRFGSRVEEALDGGLAEWAATPRGRLALVLLLDQLPRNVHRGRARAFAGDARALALAFEAIERGDDRALLPIERCFLYLPLMHAEDASVQERCVEVFTHLAREPAPDVVARQIAASLSFARTHRDAIARFGRFPARNAALGRASTEAERAFLERHPSGFAPGDEA